MIKYNIVFLDFDGVLNGSDWFSEITVKDEVTGFFKRVTESSILEYFTEDLSKLEKNSACVKVKSFGRNISKYNMNNLITLLNSIDNPAVVLSTSWRNGLFLEDWNTLFSRIPGWNFDIIGVTPSEINVPVIKEVTIKEVIESMDPVRGRDIQAWLSDFNHKVNRYVILDDDPDMLESQKEFFVQTNYRTGLTEKNIQRAINIINREDVLNGGK